jgi:hypothetical protein
MFVVQCARCGVRNVPICDLNWYTTRYLDARRYPGCVFVMGLVLKLWKFWRGLELGEDPCPP